MKTITTSASIVSLCALMSAFTASPVMADTALNTDMRQAEGQYGTLDPTQINNHTTPAAAPTNFTIGQKHASSQPDATATPDGATYHATTNMIPGNKSLVNTTTMDTGSNSYFKNYTQAIDTDTVSQPKDATSMKLSPIANMGEYVGCKDGTPPQTVSALSSSFMAKATDSVTSASTITALPQGQSMPIDCGGTTSLTTTTANVYTTKTAYVTYTPPATPTINTTTSTSSSTTTTTTTNTNTPTNTP